MNAASAARSRRPSVVIKLGGSLADSAHLGDWLGAIARGGGRSVLVPGGGPFADQVRVQQRRWGFNEATAHHLAILAMEQYGRMLAALEPVLVPAASRRVMTAVLRAGRVPVWMACAMTLGRPEIPESWSVTSDSLAAWLAGVLGANDLVLVKSADPPPGAASVHDLEREGLVDPAFPAFLAESGARGWLLGADQAKLLAAALDSGGPVGTEILCDDATARQA